MFNPRTHGKADRATRVTVTFEDSAVTYVRIAEGDTRLPKQVIVEKQATGEIPAGPIASIRVAR